MAEVQKREEEPVVDPAFFAGLKRRPPGLAARVEILPKRMRDTNKALTSMRLSCTYADQSARRNQVMRSTQTPKSTSTSQRRGWTVTALSTFCRAQQMP